MRAKYTMKLKINQGHHRDKDKRRHTRQKEGMSLTTKNDGNIEIRYELLCCYL